MEREKIKQGKGRGNEGKEDEKERKKERKKERNEARKKDPDLL
jgi:hypothetical protein